MKAPHTDPLYRWAWSILNRVRNGDKTPTHGDITRALVITGDL
jgi:hypothetical protein